MNLETFLIDFDRFQFSKVLSSWSVCLCIQSYWQILDFLRISRIWGFSFQSFHHSEQFGSLASAGLLGRSNLQILTWLIELSALHLTKQSFIFPNLTSENNLINCSSHLQIYSILIITKCQISQRILRKFHNLDPDLPLTKAIM